MRRTAGLIVLLVLVCSPALGAGNPYEAAGISNPAHVTQFLVRLKQAVAAGDSATLASMIDYPLAVHEPRGASKTYRNGAVLRAGYAQVFTPEVVEAIAAATPSNLFARDQGVMIGDGQVWMAERRGTMKIITVNHTH